MVEGQPEALRDRWLRPRGAAREDLSGHNPSRRSRCRPRAGSAVVGRGESHLLDREALPAQGQLASVDLTHQALHDSLTGLPNRALLVDRLGNTLARAERQKSKVAVLFIDLDNLKTINDSLGHECGDRLLRSVTKRVRAC